MKVIFKKSSSIYIDPEKIGTCFDKDIQKIYELFKETNAKDVDSLNPTIGYKTVNFLTVYLFKNCTCVLKDQKSIERG